MNCIKWQIVVVFSMLMIAGEADAKHKKSKADSTADYIQRMQNLVPRSGMVSNTSSLWRDSGALSNIASDYKAHSAGDIVVISIVEQTLAQASGTVATERTFNTSSSVAALPARIGTGGLNPLIRSDSDTKLKGQGQTATASSLRTSLAGRVISVLPNGYLVVQANRDVLMNNERQTISLRGVARPGDLGTNNTILSTQLSDLEVELRGKGVISEGTRQPHLAIRILLRLLSF